MHPLTVLLAIGVIPNHTWTEFTAFMLRWAHFIAGFIWVGLLYFFNLVNVPFMKQVEAAWKPKIFQHLTLPALQWFRWSSVVTVLMGFWYWAQIYVAADARRDGVSPWGTIALFLVIWIAAWGIQYLTILKMSPNGWMLGVITAVAVVAAGWLFVTFTPVGKDDNHVLSIGVGGGLGLLMMLNVWGVIWRNNKKIIRGTLAGTPPADAAVLARQAFLASRTNFFLSVPLLFFMAASSHYVILGR